MKKQILFIAVISSAILFSCSKEKPGSSTPDTQSANLTLKPIFIDPLKVALSGRFEFNGNLKDTTGKVADAIPTNNSVIYTTDRKGGVDQAIRFNETYGLNIFGISLDTSMSVSVWMKTDCYPVGAMVPVVEGARGICFYQLQDKYKAYNWNGINAQTVSSGAMDSNWHHIAATRDKYSLKFYVDGIFIGSSPTPTGADLQKLTIDYGIGYGYNAGYKYWKGSMDDLRFYKRVLSATDITKLASL